jgi:hypothetical protein
MQVMDAIAEGHLIESLCPIPNYNPNESKPNDNINDPNRITRIIQVMDAIAEGRLIESFGAGTAAIVSPVDGFRFDGKVRKWEKMKYVFFDTHSYCVGCLPLFSAVSFLLCMMMSLSIVSAIKCACVCYLA